jgi:hypothetical protein
MHSFRRPNYHPHVAVSLSRPLICIACEKQKSELYVIDILLDEPTTVEICHTCLPKCPWPVLHPETGELLELDNTLNEEKSDGN